MPSTLASGAGRRRRPEGRFLFFRPPPPRAGGFTLVELVTTLVIIGILLAYVTPRFFDDQIFKERGYADEVASALRYAHRIATSSGCPVRVTLTAAAYSAMQNSPPVLANGCPANGAWGTVVRRMDGSNLAGTPPAGVLLAPNTVITFDAAGNTAAVALNVSNRFFINVDASGGVTVAP